MGFRFRKIIKLAPGLKINLSKSGPSLSVGRPGASFNIGGKGTRTTVGAPGTGMSYTTEKSWQGYGKDLGLGSKPAAGKSSGTPKSIGKPPSGAPKYVGKPPAGALAPAATPPEKLNPSYFQRLSIPDDDEALIDGCRQLAEGHEAEALVSFQQALHLADGAYMAGLLSLKHGQYGEAVNYLSFCLERQAELGSRFKQYGIAAVVSLPVTDEIDAQVQPRIDGVLLALAEAYQHAQQPNQAAECLRRLLATTPGDLLLRLSLGELLMTSWPGERGACEETLSLAESVDNDSQYHAALLLYKARALKGLGLLTGARDVLTAALRKTKERSDELLLALRYDRALLYEQLGQAKEARADLEKIYAGDPQYEDVAARLGLKAAN